MKNTTRFEGCNYFTGIEVERTLAYGATTLFVIGVRDTAEILIHAKTVRHNGGEVTHIYLGANNSLSNLTNPEESMNRLRQQIIDLLSENYTVTLDIKLTSSRYLCGWSFLNHERFILMLSELAPNIKTLGKNAVLKLDDVEFGGSNGGVYIVPLSTIGPEFFTDWSQYERDRPC